MMNVFDLNQDFVQAWKNLIMALVAEVVGFWKTYDHVHEIQMKQNSRTTYMDFSSDNC
jgi:hypothetical protein